MAQESALSYTQTLTPDAVRAVQGKLNALAGFQGQANGAWGPDSEAALRGFQQNNGLQVTGQMNQATAATMGLDIPSLIGAAAPASAPAPAPAPAPQAPAAPPTARPLQRPPHLLPPPPRRSRYSPLAAIRCAWCKQGCVNSASITAPSMANGVAARRRRCKPSSRPTACPRMAT